jgi:eukaryotic-like serine/threonine-protein kinase
MTPERWQEVKDVLCAALELDPSERPAYLDRACSSDHSLRREVESLLESDDDIRSSFLVSPLPGPAAAPDGLEDYAGLERVPVDDGGSPAAAPGTPQVTIAGRYRLLRKLGEGGMGQVWLAEQTTPVERQVALKLIKSFLYNRSVLQRFESERQSLAIMDHPSIAKVFDAGATPSGQPYFVMEYVPGPPITHYCDARKLNVRDRLELFVQVCEAVQHAHQKAIIHRDLKPANILVADIDGKAMPRVIDFGIAKVLSQPVSDESAFTRPGAMVGTPGYMSPEQADPSTEGVDTRTDVYSLGVILYELLTGLLPFDTKEWRDRPLHEVLRQLHEDDPQLPSTRVGAQKESSTQAAELRSTAPRQLVSLLRGDLDCITMKALEKDRARRYGSPSDFAADIERYLRNQAVLAVPPSAVYRARKFARRHRGALVTACTVAAVLIAAAVVSIRQSIRANREAAVAQAVNDFLQNDLLAQASAANQSGPSTKPDPHLEVRTALDRAAARIAGKFDRQPEVEAAIRTTIGKTYLDLGMYPEARTQLERALELQRRVVGAESPQTLRTTASLAVALENQGKYPEAEKLLGQSLDIQRRMLGPEHPDTLRSMNSLAVVYYYEGKYAQAEALCGQVVQIRRRLLGPEHHDTLASTNILAVVYEQEGKYPQAEALHGQTLEIERRVLGPEHPDTQASMNNLANVYQSEGKYAQAEVLYTQTLEIVRRVLGPEHRSTLLSMNNLAEAYETEGKYSEAEALHSQLLEIRRRVLGPEHPDTQASIDNLANVYLAEGKYAQAEVLCIQTLDGVRRVLGPENRFTLLSMNNLAEAYAGEGKYPQAEDLYSQLLEIRRRVLGPEHPDTLYALSGFASMYQREGKYALAESYEAQALAGRRHALGPEHPDTMQSAADLALAYLSQGEFIESEPLAREALQFNQKKQPDSWQRFRAESLLGASVTGEKKYAEAEPLLLEGYQGMFARKDRIDAPDLYHLDLAHRWIVQLYQAWGKPDRVAEWKQK